MNVRRVLSVVFAGLALTGCGGIPTPYNNPVTSGAEGRIGDLVVADARLVDTGGSLVVLATIVNSGREPDRLVGLDSPVAGRDSISGATDLPPGATRTAGAAIPAPDSPAVQLQLIDLRNRIDPGVSYPVVLHFARAGRLTLQLALADPASPRPDCPLPPGGRPDRVFAAPFEAAPLPEPSPVPSCSTLLHEEVSATPTG
jgi:hypothetical protein